MKAIRPDWSYSVPSDSLSLGLYAEASALEPLLPRDGRRAWRVMTISYREILREIECRDYNVFGPPIRFSRWRRVRLAARGLVGQQPAVVPPLRARESSVAATQRRSA